MKAEKKAELLGILREVNATGHRLNNVSFLEGVALGDPDTTQAVVENKAETSDKALRAFERAVLKLEEALK